MDDFLLKEQMQKLEEILRIKQLNLELLNTLEATLIWTLNYAKRHNIPIPKQSLHFLLRKAMALIDEMNSPPKFQHQFRTPKDSTEPQ